MKKDHRPPDTSPPPDVQAWLDSLPPQERQELLRTWQWAALGQEEASHSEAVQTAWARLQHQAQTPHDIHRAPDRPTHSHQRRPNMQKIILLLAFLLAGAAAVFYLLPDAAHRDQVADVAEQQAHFMLLLHDEGLTLTTPEEQEAAVAEYVAWAGELATAGRLVAGDELAPEGDLLEGTENPIVRPISESTDRIGGYFIIAAANYDEALTLARGCPQLRYGGSVEVRPILQR